MMSSFSYRVIDAQGRRTRGVAEAENPDGLTHLLESRGLLVLDVERVTRSDVRALSSTRAARRDILELTRALAALLGAGLPLSRALVTAAEIAAYGADLHQRNLTEAHFYADDANVPDEVWGAIKAL